MLLQEKIYFKELITTILWFYELKDFLEQLNELKVDDDGINPMGKFSDTTTEITLKTNHTWGYTVFIFNAILQGNVYVSTK